MQYGLEQSTRGRYLGGELLGVFRQLQEALKDPRGAQEEGRLDIAQDGHHLELQRNSVRPLPSSLDLH